MKTSLTPGAVKSPEKPLEGKTVLVLVQGPLDQSPRMAAQAAMLAAAGARVRALGFGQVDDAMAPGVSWRAPEIETLLLPGAGRDLSARRRTGLLRTALRLLSTAGGLRRALASSLVGADMVLAQLPPALPGLWLAYRLARRQGIPLVIDWHNLSAPMAALRLGRRHPSLGLLRLVERLLARRAAAQFTVTPALAEHLQRHYGAHATPLPDRPLVAARKPHRRPLTPQALVARIGAAPLDEARRWTTVAAPTSWSLDEDMGIVIEAVRQLRIPDGRGLLVVATGKGPGRTGFEQQARDVARPGLRLETAWLSEPDYRALLQGAAAGLSLHRSASGLDFPMKLVDMEAAGLEALALDYGPVLHAGLAGRGKVRTFADASELAGLLEELLQREPTAGVASIHDSWDAAWRRIALPELLAVTP